MEQKKNIYHYGSDSTYEVCDKTGVTKELVNNHGVIEFIDNSGNLRGGWGVSVVDPVSTNTNYGENYQKVLGQNAQEREILHVDNSSQLFVNSICVGGSILAVDENGDLWFKNTKTGVSTQLSFPVS
jgi:hypothetical protein